MATLTTTLSKPLSSKPKLPKLHLKPKTFTTISCSTSNENQQDPSTSLKTFSAALALSSILLSSAATAPPPASADIAGLTPCKESKAFAKREKQSIKKLESSLKLYAPDSAPALAIKATIEKTKKRFDNYGKYGLLCGTDGLPHLIVSGDQRHWGCSSGASSGLLPHTGSWSMVTLLSRMSKQWEVGEAFTGPIRRKLKLCLDGT
ncbi:hypothetical protein J5N97_028417 [Dioscorea zingiberensis]|uniref:Photosystem I reaction center subunit III n=1 Tax=Dioscorea zingiberensis TaxID=325984 RepID=A0A9D5BZ50_9LILI|nr:hypothetical protein J5N97_028417 [Dioscorea zingiberensis]